MNQIIYDNNHCNKSSLKKRIYFYLIMIFGVLFSIVIGVEISLRVIYFQMHGGYPLALKSSYEYLLPRLCAKGHGRLIWHKSLYRHDRILGYSNIPGVHTFTQEWQLFNIKKTHTFTAILDDEGYRTTSKNPEQYANKPEIWIFGCSFTWGWGLDNKDTFPWLLQEKLGNFRVRNLGVNGYGNIHALLQLNEKINSSNNSKKPIVCVFVYNSFFLDRNAATPSRLNSFVTTPKQASQKLYHPRPFVNNKGSLDIILVPIESSSDPDPDILYMQRITMMIFDEINKLCDKNSIIPIVAFQTGNSDDPIIQFCNQIGFKVIDISCELTSKYRLLPFDSHPNRMANEIWAEKLYASLKSILGQ